MGRIIIDVPVTGTKTMETVKALLDSGADKNYIKPDLAERLGIVEVITDLWEVDAAGQTIKGTKEIELVELNIQDHIIQKPRFLVGEWIDFPIVIGAEPMQSWGVSLVMEQEKPEIKFRHPRARYASMASERIGGRKTTEEIREAMELEVRLPWKVDADYVYFRYWGGENPLDFPKNVKLKGMPYVFHDFSRDEMHVLYAPREKMALPAGFRRVSDWVPVAPSPEKEKLERFVRIKAPQSDWDALFKWIDEGRITTEDQLEHTIEERPFATPAGYTRIPLDQVPPFAVFKGNEPDPFWSSLNVYEDYETKTKYLVPLVNPKFIAFKEVK